MTGMTLAQFFTAVGVWEVCRLIARLILSTGAPRPADRTPPAALRAPYTDTEDAERDIHACWGALREEARRI